MNKKIKRQTALLSLVLALSVLLAACGSKTTSASGTTTTTAVTADDDMFSDRDYEVGYSDYTTVTLKDNASKADGNGVTIDGNTITVTAEGTYLFTGTLTDGQIVVNVKDTEKVQIVLDNASITSSDSAAIYVKCADKVFLTTAKDSTNTVSSSTTTNIDAAIFSKEDLTLNGQGTLTVTCDNGHGVVSKDDLKVTSGTYKITAAKKGLDGKDSVRIADGTISITAGTDGIHSDNADETDKGFVYIKGGTISITAGDDGVHATSTLTIKGGKITVKKSYEGLEGQAIVIAGGTMDITASDDGLNAAGGNDDSASGGQQDAFQTDTDASVTISGGTLTVNADGDGLDSNGTLTVSGGTIYVSGPTNGGNGAIDAGGTASITGGTIIAAGAEGMDMNFGSSSTQCSILYQFSSVQSAGTTVKLTDSDGTVLASYTPVKEYQSVVISTPKLEKGSTYTLTAGSEKESIKLSDTIYGTGSESGGGGQMGGGQQGGQMGGGQMGSRS